MNGSLPFRDGNGACNCLIVRASGGTQVRCRKIDGDITYSWAIKRHCEYRYAITFTDHREIDINDRQRCLELVVDDAGLDGFFVEVLAFN